MAKIGKSYDIGTDGWGVSNPTGIVIRNDIWAVGIPISPGYELKSVASGSIRYKVIRYRRWSGCDRPPCIADHNVIVDDNRVAAQVSHRAGLGFGNGESGRPDEGHRRRKGNALAPKERTDGSTIVTRTIICDEWNDVTRNRVIKGVCPDGGRHATGAIGTAKSTGGVIKGCAVPGVSARVICRGSAGISARNISVLYPTRCAGDDRMLATRAGDIEYPGRKSVLGRGVLGGNGYVDTSPSQQGRRHGHTSWSAGPASAGSASVGEGAEQGPTHIYSGGVVAGSANGRGRRGTLGLGLVRNGQG